MSKKGIVCGRIMFFLTIVGEYTLIDSILNLLGVKSNLVIAYVLYILCLLANVYMLVTIEEAIKENVKNKE